jgi:WD40 repeat protein
VGKVTVIDANTLRFEDGTQVQVAGGSDAPDLGQQARLSGAFYSCGKDAAEFLKNLIADRPVSFYAFESLQNKDPQNRSRGVCFVGETDLGMELVRNGWALALHSGMTPYEIIARSNKRGLWRGDFVLPESWRNGERLPGEALLSEVDSLDANHAEQLIFSRDGKLLAAAFGQPAVKVWRMDNRTQVLRGAHGEEQRWCRAVAFAPGDKLLASGDDGGIIKLWDVSARRLVATLVCKTDDDTSGLAFSTDGKTLLRGGRNGVHVWDVATSSEVAEWKRPDKERSGFALSHDGRLAASGYDDGAILISDAATGKELRKLVGHNRNVRALAFSSDDKVLASGDGDMQVKVWDVAAWQVRSTLKGGIGKVRSIAFSPNGRLLAAASIGGPTTLWDLGSQRELTRLVTGGFSVAFSPDGMLLATGAGDGPVKLWRVSVTEGAAPVRGLIVRF